MDAARRHGEALFICPRCYDVDGEAEFRRRGARVGALLLGRRTNHVPGDGGVEAVSQAALEGGFYAAVFAGVES